MLTLRKLEMSDFGPYLGDQQITFAEEGVTVIFGDNGRGKTSLMNAIHWALYGRVETRGGRDRRWSKLVNRERAAAGDWSFKVTLSFVFDGQKCEVIRGVIAGKGVARPVHDTDFIQQCVLTVDGDTLGPQQRDVFLKKVLPVEVARFFLFDGEMLQRYEQLLIDGSEDGARIADEIERIVGVPYLRSGQEHLGLLKKAALDDLEREAKKNAPTTEAATKLAAARETLELREGERDGMQEEVDAWEQQVAEHTEYLKTQEKNERLLTEWDEKREIGRQAEETIAAEMERMRAALDDSWRGLVSPRVKTAISRAEREAQDALGKITVALRAQAVESGDCGVCETHLDDEHRSRLGATVPPGVTADPTALVHDASSLVARSASLSGFSVASREKDVTSCWEQIEQARLRSNNANGRIGEIQDVLDDETARDIRQSDVSIRSLTDKIKAHQDSIQETNEIIEDLNVQVTKWTKAIEEAGDGGFTSTQDQAHLLSAAEEIFGQAIETYKADLRGRVEADATDLFKRMISEKRDYTQLRINNAYGLSIVHTDGAEEEGRSAGQEHVVALSLIAALQANAPIRGPIVMDSPFGRLDGTHTGNIIEALPTLATQTVLLVFPDEVDPQMMRDRLRPSGALKKEYQLQYVSARHVEIEELT